MKILFIIAGLLFVALIGVFILRSSGSSMQENEVENIAVPTDVVEMEDGEIFEDDEEIVPPPLKLESEIPIVIEKGSKTFSLSGETPGTMFFEASCPITVKDDEGTIVYVGLATATDDPSNSSGPGWMTEAYVPFTAVLNTIAEPTGEYGTMIFTRDNPSGLAEHDFSFEIPVEFVDVL